MEMIRFNNYVKRNEYIRKENIKIFTHTWVTQNTSNEMCLWVKDNEWQCEGIELYIEDIEDNCAHIESWQIGTLLDEKCKDIKIVIIKK